MDKALAAAASQAGPRG